MADSLKEAVAKRVREARKNAKLTQQQIADKIGCTKQNVSHWETARWLPAHEDLVPLAKLLNTTTDYLLTGIMNLAPGSSVGNARIPIMVPYPDREQLLDIARGKLDPDKVQRRWPSGHADADGLIILDVPDRAMEPRIPHDARVTIKRSKMPEPGAIVLAALLASNELLLRRYRPGPSGRPGHLPFTLKPENPDFGDVRHIGKEDKPVIIGSVVSMSVAISR
jgi:transcriptional regulator with XRE-family HTH domain